jgi:hypothetical protein
VTRAAQLLRTSTLARAAAVTVVLAALTVLATWPHLERFGTTVLGAGGDVPQSIRLLWAVDDQGGSTFTTTRDYYLGAPEGTPVLRAAALANPIFNGMVLVLGHLFGWVVAINAYNLVAFVLSGTAMFFVLDRLRFGIAAAVFGTYVFVFNPNHVEKLFGSATLAATGIVPLMLLALMSLRARASWRRGALAGALLLAAFYLDSYIGLLTLWLTVAFCAVELVLRRPGWSRWRILSSYYFVAVVWVLGMIPVAIAWAANSKSVNAFAATRTQALVGGSADLQTYVLPGPRNPWLGGPMRHWLVTNLSWESTMFIGYTTMALAIAGVVIAIVKHRRRELSRDAAFFVVFAVVLTLSAIWASLPSTVGVAGIEVPTPQWFIRHATTVYRVFSRMGVLAGFGMILLAVYALSNLPRGRLYRALPFAALVVVALELYVPRPEVLRVQDLPTPVNVAQLATFESGKPRIADLGHPPAYVTWLRDHPGGLVADYPNPEAPNGRWAWKDVFEQYEHRHPLWQIATDQVDTTGVRTFASDLANGLAANALATANVKYVVLHRDRYWDLAKPAPTKICGLREMARFSNGDVIVYRVVAHADAGWVTSAGFRSPYNTAMWPEDRGLRWMGDTATIRVFWPHEGNAYVSAFAVSLARPRALEAFDSAGKSVGSWEIPPNGTTFRFGLPLERGFNSFTLRATPGSEPRGSGDPRSVAIAMAPLTLTDAGQDPEQAVTTAPVCAAE